MGAGRREASGRSSVPNSLFGVVQPVRRGDRRRLDRLSREAAATQAPRRRLPQRAELLRGAEPGGGVGSPTADGGARRLDRDDGPRPRPGADPATSGTPRWAPDETTIWANFQGADPNTELVEINVRRSVFYPTEHHIDYITVRGFELAHAACPWTPPTADQPGLIGPNWAKGWIIEDNVIHDAKCSAVSLGKEASTGHNYATLRRRQAGLPVPARVGVRRPPDRLGP